MTFKDSFITYEAFGATGDGVTDDLPAICGAHEYANEHGFPVRTKPDATYHLGSRALTVIIATNTDWNTSRFTIDDTLVEDHKTPLFEVRSLLAPEELRIDRLTRDQKRLAARIERDCHVLVESDNKRRYIRRGLNENQGVPQHDCFILRRDGAVEGTIDWNYDSITRIEARPIDEKPLVLCGGVFTTFANRMKQDIGYNYWSRNIVITRSNTEVEGLTHYVVGETSVGDPYAGFISVRQCANITLRSCFATGHKVYSTIGSAGQPVNMGSYDYNANNVVNFRMINCRMNHICDRTRWGVIGSNFCKNILLEDCTLSRMDTHMGVSGTYTIRRCNLGHMGLNAIGRGLLTVEDSTLYGNSLVNFRSDYGSTWEGDLVIRNCCWVPACGDVTRPYMIGVRNDGMHDFGYPCFMPREITINGLFVDDKNHPEDYQGMYFFTNPDNNHAGGEAIMPAAEERPFPYARCEKVRVQGLSTASGKKPRVSPNAEIQKGTIVVEET
ncbi:TPA: hypothetical protein EYN98_27770 [Candidatus Poribacteria bacterium]|jgi:hypothetical protein|nr:hypothetical protein [Candidatus Poribacteria bacterium]